MTLIVILMSSSCSQKASLEKLSTPEDRAVAQSYIDQLRLRQFDAIEAAIDENIKSPDLRDKLSKMADTLPAGEPSSIKVIGVQVFESPQLRQVNTSFEYDFGGKWFVTNVALQDKEGIKTIIGLNVYILQQPLEVQNRFTFSGKGMAHFAIFGGCILVALLTLSALVLCLSTKMGKKKWLWILFILLGVGKITINWTTGQISFQLLVIQLFSISATAAPYGPWIIAVSLPIGSIAFLAYRKRLANPSKTEAKYSPRIILK